MTRLTLTADDEARFRLLVAHANTEHAAIARVERDMEAMRRRGFVEEEAG